MCSSLPICICFFNHFLSFIHFPFCLPFCNLFVLIPFSSRVPTSLNFVLLPTILATVFRLAELRECPILWASFYVTPCVAQRFRLSRTIRLHLNALSLGNQTYRVIEYVVLGQGRRHCGALRNSHDNVTHAAHLNTNCRQCHLLYSSQNSWW